MKPLVFKLTTVGAAAGRGRPPQAETAQSEKFFLSVFFFFFFEVPDNYRTVFASNPAPLLFDNKVSHLVGSY